MQHTRSRSRNAYGVQSAYFPSLKLSFENSAVEAWIRSIFCIAFPGMNAFTNGDDMFVLGLDSVKSMELMGALKATLAQ